MSAHPSPPRHYKDFHQTASYWFKCERCHEPFQTEVFVAYCPLCAERLEAHGFRTDTGEVSGA